MLWMFKGPRTKLGDLLDASLLSRNSRKFCKTKTIERFIELGMGGPSLPCHFQRRLGNQNARAFCSAKTLELFSYYEQGIKRGMQLL